MSLPRPTFLDRSWRAIPAVFAAVLMLTACGGGSDPAPNMQAAANPPAAPASAPTPAPDPTTAPAPTDPKFVVGDRLFHEPALSASGRQSCASCHEASRGHADPLGTFLPLGGADGQQQGIRSTPTSRYLDAAGPFTFNDQGQPRGGLLWDGRADTRAQQARGPLFSAAEMANASTADYVRRLRTTGAYGELLRAYSLNETASDEALLSASLDALAQYQARDPDYHPFTSKFDRVQAGQASFTAAEARGLAAFNDPQRGNCASCHDSQPRNGRAALFTDFSYHALGVPRTVSTATAAPNFFDLGLCGPLRTDLSGRTELCGRFKVPTLRNVAVTGPYFHNARFSTLEEVVSFYALRDVDPARFYPVMSGQVQRFDDLPLAYHANVERRAPFAPLPGNRARLSPQEVSDIVAFLNTLTDAPPTAP
ncbi:cytochrome-c peroxidase [Inhella gelatinilytica]|uniref:C-type cytochrome n=1 Tax=Inhella gelatinilytica TaxID=2795030 RepID=A0A931J139_9BURK|nr:cytochrome c peroxidase [Inhella gelatinilytica]MBH9553583.1 c-type cytochrome [Inhella gelatinilytica]